MEFDSREMRATILLHKSKRGKGETKRWGFFQKKGQQIAGVKWCVEIDYSFRVQLSPLSFAEICQQFLVSIFKLFRMLDIEIIGMYDLLPLSKIVVLFSIF